MDTNEGYTVCLPTDNRLLEHAVRAYSVGLVVLDPLLSAIDSRINTRDDNRGTRTALEPLVKIAHRTGAVMLGIAHFNKAQNTDAASLLTDRPPSAKSPARSSDSPPTRPAATRSSPKSRTASAAATSVPGLSHRYRRHRNAGR